MNKMNQLFEGFRRWGTLTEEQLLAEGRLEDAKKKYPGLHPDAIDALSARDPSGKNKYLMWASKQLNKKILEYIARTDRHGNEVDHDEFYPVVRGIARTIEAFHKNVQRLKNRDINSYISVEHVDEVLDALGLSLRQQKSKKREIAQEDSTNIEETDEFWMIRPDSVEASCYYGRATRWCISATKSQNYFNQYTNDGKTFYMVMLKHLDDDDDGKKMALVYDANSGDRGDDEPEETYDAADDEVGTDGMLENVTKNIIGAHFSDYGGVFDELTEFVDHPIEENYTDNIRKLATEMLKSGDHETEIDADHIEGSNPEELAEAMSNTFAEAMREIFSAAYYHNEENPGGPTEQDYQDLLDLYESDFEHVSVSMEDYGEGSGVYYNGYMSFELDEGDLEFAPDGDGMEMDASDWEDEILEIFRSVADDNYVYPDEAGTETYSGFEIRFNFNPDNEQHGSPEGFESFLDSMKEADQKYDEIMERALEEMAEQGITRSDEYDSKEELYGKLSKLKNFDTAFEKGKIKFWLKDDFEFTLPLARAMEIDDVRGPEPRGTDAPLASQDQGRKDWIKYQLNSMQSAFEKNTIFKNAFDATWPLSHDATQEKKKQQPMFPVSEVRLYSNPGESEAVEGFFNMLDFSTDNGGTVEGQILFKNISVNDERMLNYMSWLDGNLDAFYDAMAHAILTKAEERTKGNKRSWPEKFKSMSVKGDAGTYVPRTDLNEKVSYGRLCESWKKWSEG